MNGIECLGEFHVFFFLFVLPWNYGSLKEKKKKRFLPSYILFVHSSSPIKKKNI